MHIRTLFESSNFQASREANELNEERSFLQGKRVRRKQTYMKRDPRPREANENIRPSRPVDGYQELWRAYESKWNDFSTTPPRHLNFDMIPFPPCDDDVLEFIAKFNMLGRDMRAAYRLACRRFHPDKFMQAYGSQIVSSDTEKILSRLTSITQSVNNQYASCKRMRRILSEPPR